MIEDGRVLVLGVAALGAAAAAVAAREGSSVRLGRRFRIAEAAAPVRALDGPVFLSLSNHLAELGAMSREADDLDPWDPDRVVAAPSVKEAEKRARRDYEAVLGKRFLVREVTGTLGGTFDETETWICDEGCLVKVLPASDQDIVSQWSTTVRLDPIWPIEILGTLPEDLKHLTDLDWAYTRGRSYVVVTPR